LILEYLFLNQELKEEIFNYKGNNINIKIKDIKESEFWLAEFVVDKENEQSALALSKINEDIIKNYDCITLTNESAFYYNKKLYPLINEFERKLRKLLYLASKLSSDSTDSEIIQDLEKMDFGTLFELIFTDENFIKNVKTKINNKTWKYNKSEIMDELYKIEEKTLWDKLLGAEIAPTLRENFLIIKNYRNNIMHAHNIDTEHYKKIKKMFITANKELDSAISDILNNKIEKLYKDSNQNFSKALRAAIDAESINRISNIYSQQLKEIAEATKFAIDIPPVSQQLKEMAEAAKFAIDIPPVSQQLKEMVEAANLVRDIAPVNQQLKEMAEAAKLARDIAPVSQQLKEMVEAAKLAREISPVNQQFKETEIDTQNTDNEKEDICDNT